MRGRVLLLAVLIAAPALGAPKGKATKAAAKEPAPAEAAPVAAPAPAPPPAAPEPPPPQPARVAPSTKPTLLVLDFAAERGVDASLAKAVHSIFLSRIQDLGRYSVISKDDLRTLLNVQSERELMGCTDDKCIVDMAGGLGARWVVAGSLGRLGDQAVLDTRLIDSERGTVDARASELAPSAEESALVEAAARSVEKLFPAPAPSAALAAGPAVEPPRPLYQSPWFWVAAGAAVSVMGVGGYFLFRTPLPDATLGDAVLDAR